MNRELSGDSTGCPVVNAASNAFVLVLSVGARGRERRGIRLDEGLVALLHPEHLPVAELADTLLRELATVAGGRDAAERNPRVGVPELVDELTLRERATIGFPVSVVMSRA
ncbi:hypothetical protein [Haloarchaeobius litoreus]|uniref:Uncharacterized protein n=1 Tax=Haloarchaeobius litoreus TaxID=755306 RepID=A0ABD6DPF0_9EURY|nr:hypothetical protein [Haloarchaeobius litoreus]